MVFVHPLHGWNVGLALLHLVRTAVVEVTTEALLVRGRDIAGEDYALPFPLDHRVGYGSR